MKKTESVGIDVSKLDLDVAVLGEEGTEFGRFRNEKEEKINEMLSFLQSRGVSPTTPIVVESTGSYHWLVCVMLSEAGYNVCVINPLLTKKYQLASIRGAKTDRIDAARLAEIGLREKSLSKFFDSRETLSHRRYVSLLSKVEHVKQQLSRAYKAAVEATDCLGVCLDLECLEATLTQLDMCRDMLKQAIERNAENRAQYLADSTRGLSLFQAAVLCQAVSGKHFETKEQLIAFFGLDVRKRESGSWRGRERLSKRGNAYYRKILFQIGWSLKQNNPHYTAYHRSLTDRNKHYYTATIATARKFLRFFWAIKFKNL